MDKSLLMFRKLYFSHPAGLVCITASFNRLTLQRCFFHCSVSKSTMPLPAFFLRQLRRRGLLIGLAGLAIVLVVAQVYYYGSTFFSHGEEGNILHLRKLNQPFAWQEEEVDCPLT